MTYRIERLNSLLRQEISDIIQRQVKDPRLGVFVSVTAVDVSSDLKFAKVFVSCMGSEDEKKDTLKALTSAAGFIRHELGNRMQARRIPEVSFRLDDTIEKADKVLRLIDQISVVEDTES